MKTSKDPIRDYLRARGCGQHVVEGGLPYLVESWERFAGEVEKGYDGSLHEWLNDADGREIYWFRIEPVLGVDDQADRWAVEQGWVSMTPIALDVTDEHALETLRRVRPLDTVRAAQLSRPVSSDAEAARVREDEIQPPLQSPAS